MLPWSADLAGRIDEQVIDSGLLRGNPLGDPHERPLYVYLPPGYDAEPGRRYPTVYVIQGYTGHVAMWRNRSAFRQPFPETADAMFARGEAPPAIVVYVDAWTGYGGSLYAPEVGSLVVGHLLNAGLVIALAAAAAALSEHPSTAAIPPARTSAARSSHDWRDGIGVIAAQHTTREEIRSGALAASHSPIIAPMEMPQ